LRAALVLILLRSFVIIESHPDISFLPQTCGRLVQRKTVLKMKSVVGSCRTITA